MASLPFVRDVLVPKIQEVHVVCTALKRPRFADASHLTVWGHAWRDGPLSLPGDDRVRDGREHKTTNVAHRADSCSVAVLCRRITSGTGAECQSSCCAMMRQMQPSVSLVARAAAPPPAAALSRAPGCCQTPSSLPPRPSEPPFSSPGPVTATMPVMFPVSRELRPGGTRGNIKSLKLPAVLQCPLHHRNSST